jgi:hypothetical protein
MGTHSVVEIPKLFAALRIVFQDPLREIGSLQVLRPGAVEVIDALVHSLQSMDVSV